ncbi:hypothetical protein like AT2G21840 [Hibiscus trionum]|uniref:Phorbol-ester/DAG-type domain-containing protein n=1 Tax=Hibiscus trionum TaxID=183268 RepID=A0A9W7GT68_HIBTR|nr:hypothetical protein like AT2G21840 [Hibiscus trionum]
MEFQHFLHPHKLSSTEVGMENNTLRCFGCLDIIHGPAYICETCDDDEFVMHKSCAELPPQFQKHTFHPHPLRFNVFDMFVCDACRRLTTCYIGYMCMYCELKLDFKCAVAIFNDENGEEAEAHQGTIIHHFCHPHQLTRCIYSYSLTTENEIDLLEELWGSRKLKCVACKQEIQGTLYICLACKFVIHESCMNEMPTQVQRSPFHPHHALLPRPFLPDRDASRQVRCYACSRKVKGFSFYCNKCDVNLHVSCAKYQTRDIKHTYHPHNLVQLGKSIIHNISCNACGEDCHDSCFSCKKCDFNIHPQCIPLPSSFTHKYHLHPLALVSPFVEDDSGDYYCDMCETERNPELQVYYCEECNYIAHIDCVLSEVLEPTIEMLLDPEETSGDDNWELEEKRNNKMIQRDFIHPHPLTLNDDPETTFVCDGCEQLCRGLSYSCQLCSFFLDTRCATSNDKTQELRRIKTTVNHFSHFHQLTRCKFNILQMEPEFDECCRACRQGLCGIIYACVYCEFFLHESCLEDMSLEVQSLFHPHPLRIFLLRGKGSSDCDVCGGNVEVLAYVCFACGVGMHYSCANYQFRELKHGCPADHRLLHLGKGFFGDESPDCDECGQACENTLFCCLKCKFYIHLECIPLPSVVKHKRHLHPLLLTTLTEDDTGDYYCDTCETQRNPEHEVYHCQQCNYISHIDCVTSEVEPPERIIQYLTPRSEDSSPGHRSLQAILLHHH